MKWYRFDKAKGYRQKRPPVGKYVLVLIPPKERGLPCGVALGYRKNAAGCADSPYFVIPGIGGEVIAWCDCLPSELDYPQDINSQELTKRGEDKLWKNLG